MQTLHDRHRSLLAACSSALALPSQTAMSADPEVVRAGGPAALEQLLAKYDRMQPGAERDELAQQIDQVAAQKHATVSRMYWYTDLASAKLSQRGEEFQQNYVWYRGTIERGAKGFQSTCTSASAWSDGCKP